jgi:hypothetical protein
MSCAPHTWISAARFAPFLNAAEGNYALAPDLYDWHAELASASFAAIHHFEVIVRNAIDDVLGEGQPQEPLRKTWLLDFDTLQPGAVKQVIVAVERAGSGKPITRGRVVAGVPFGFWTSLFTKHYEELWRQRLRRAFPHGAPERRDLAAPMERIRRLRNRVAHHDCLLAQDVGAVSREMFGIVALIDPFALAWLEGRTRIGVLLEEMPGLNAAQACSVTGTSPAPAGSSR